VDACYAGMMAAASMDKYLGGDGKVEDVLAPEQEVSDRLTKIDDIATRLRQCKAGEALNAESAKKESERCLQCDLRLRLAPQKFWSDYKYA
jgi:hypothetical protein